jgi:hypothetical protein
MWAPKASGIDGYRAPAPLQRVESFLNHRDFVGRMICSAWGNSGLSMSHLKGL